MLNQILNNYDATIKFNDSPDVWISKANLAIEPGVTILALKIDCRLFNARSATSCFSKIKMDDHNKYLIFAAETC